MSITGRVRLPAPGVSVVSASVDVDAVLRVDTDADERIERVARFAQHLLGVECVILRLANGEQAWPKVLDHAQLGLDEGMLRELRTTTEVSDRPTVIGDVLEHDRYGRLATSVRFVVAAPLIKADDRLGGLLALGLQPQEVTEELVAMVGEVTRWALEELGLVSDQARGFRVQQGLLPKTMLSLEGWDVAGLSRPMRAVGGDFYDWYPVRGGAALTIGDVMGKGISAALIGATVRATMRSSSRVDGPAAAVESASDTVAGDLEDAGVFVTLFHGHLNESTGRLRYIDAGHGLSLIVHRDGATQRLEPTGVPLGTGWEDEWEERVTRLLPGDVFVSVSDGVLDSWGGSLDALEKVQDIVRRSYSAREIVNTIAANSVPDAQDDVTIVAVRRELAGD